MWWGVGDLPLWGGGSERLEFWEALFFVFVVMVWVLSAAAGVGGFGVLRGWD